MNLTENRALAKWGKLLESQLGITDHEKKSWIAEYAENHNNYGLVVENTGFAYANAAIAGMGAITSPQPSYYAGSNTNTSTSATRNAFGNQGSGDVAQNMLPVSLKIAAQTIGLDLVAVKPTPGPAVTLVYMDYQYDDVNLAQGKPQVFQVSDTSAKMTVYRAALRQFMSNNNIPEAIGGFQLTTAVDGTAPRIYININTGAVTTTAPTTKTNMVEFLGFSRINNNLILRAFHTPNAFGNHSVNAPYAAPYPTWDATQNTFSPTASIVDSFVKLPASTTDFTTGGATTVGTVAVELVSALEDHIIGFSSNFTANSRGGQFPMSRDEDDDAYAGNIGVRTFTKQVTVGTIQVDSALRRTEIEDIKATTGIDVLQKVESLLVNELSQTISRQIIYRLRMLGEKNRLTAAPAIGTVSNSISGQTVFDLDTQYATVNAAPGGETTHAIQRMLFTKLSYASSYIMREGRVGMATFVVTNTRLANALRAISDYTISPINGKTQFSANDLYPMGTFGGVQIYIDPYQSDLDNTILIGRKNTVDQPGLLFIPYLMAESITTIAEGTMAPKIRLRSRYSIAEYGFYPEKQYLTIKVADPGQLLG